MDILQLVDRLEEIIEKGRSWPFGGKVLVDREALLNVIDQMRITLPTEVKRHQAFEIERAHYIAKAQEDARAILEQAREEAAKLLDSHEIKRQAEEEAERILAQARREADEMRADADIYAAESLRRLERHVQQLLHVIQNGLKDLNARLNPTDAQDDEVVN